ncbi:MAG: hypothetical protein ABIU09_00270 [Pyrinomonadaceae bacterium]
MKKLAAELLFGKNAMFSGIIALSVVAAIALGCSCGKEFGNLGKDDNSTTASNTTEPSNTATTAPRGEKADASTGKIPADDQLQDLARTTIMDFNDAIQSEDFTDFHRTVSKPFQKEASPARFKEVFQSFIDAGIDFKEVRSMTANFTTPTSIDKSRGAKTLNLKGNYATSPRRTNFDLKYVPEGSDWKLIYLEINTKDQ